MDISGVLNETVTRVTSVIAGGEAELPIPPAFDTVAKQVSFTLSSASVPEVPHIDWNDIALARAIVATVLPPLIWNLIGPFEYYTRLVSKVTLRPIIGVYLSALIIASLSVFRSTLFMAAISSQPKFEGMDNIYVDAVGGVIFVFGLMMFLGAYYRLGITGTYLGDYFGILRDERITAFPFNVLDNPMYDGQSLIHLAEALLLRSPAGVLLAFWMFICYRTACIIEEPFTAKMYAERDRMREKRLKSS